MTVKTILACLTSEKHAPSMLAVAKGIARRHTAHVIGLHTLQALTIYPAVGMYVPEDVYASFNASQVEQSKAIEAVFRSEMQGEDFPNEWREVNAQVDNAAEQMNESARACDVVLMTQGDTDVDRPDQRNAQEHVIRGSGRPVLLVPHGANEQPVGQNILVGLEFDARGHPRRA